MTESTAGESRELMERLESVVSEQFAASGASTARYTVSESDPTGRGVTTEAAEGQFYAVWLRNGTDYTLTVTIYFITSTSPDVVQENTRVSPPHEDIPFVLGGAGQCDRLVAYVIGVFYEGQLVLRIPESDVMTPQLASEVNPADAEPCIDLWAIG